MAQRGQLRFLNRATMKMQILAISLLLSLLSSVAPAGQVDPRFDGKWIGVETFQLNNAWQTWASGPPQFNTVIVIANSGKELGVLAGLAPGRYQVSPKSSGNTLIFEMPNPKPDAVLYIGRKECSLVLSSDGNSLKERGLGLMFSRNRGPVMCEVYATFRRAGK
jgi:hypothetical protein